MVDERVVPTELVVGISYEKAFVTYYETKKNVRDLNSKASWTQWSSNSENPLIVENKFSTGFKLASPNFRNSSGSSIMTLTHPLFNKKIEISLSRFIEIASVSIITNGVIDTPLIMDFDRNLLMEKEYNERVLKANKEDEKQNAQESFLKVSKKDFLPGHVYWDKKHYLLYLGSISYLKDEETCFSHIFFKIKIKDSFSQTKASLTKDIFNFEQRNYYLPVLDFVSISTLRTMKFDPVLSTVDFFEDLTERDFSRFSDKIKGSKSWFLNDYKSSYGESFFVHFEQDYLNSIGK